MNTCEVRGYTKTFKGKMVKVKGYSRKVGIRGVHTTPVKKKTQGKELEKKIAEKFEYKPPVWNEPAIDLIQASYDTQRRAQANKQKEWREKDLALFKENLKKYKKPTPKFDVSKVKKIAKKRSILDKISDELGILSGRRRS